MGPRPIEELLRAESPDLANKYAIIKERLTTGIQTRWCARWAEGNDHGPGHIDRVLANLSALLGADPIGQGRINAFELFLAGTAAVAHDIGVIDGRDGHANRSAELLQIIAESNTFLFDKHSLSVLEAAIVCHSSHTDIEEVCQSFSFMESFVGNEVRPRFVAALLRLSDELDEDRRRAEGWVQKLAGVPEASRPYWEFCQRIQGIRFDESSITFNVVFEAEDAGKIVLTDKVQKSFLRFFATKVAKINREREVTKRYLGALCRDRLVVSVRPLGGMPDWRVPRTFTFLDGSCSSKQAEQESVESFLRMFPELERGGPQGGERAAFVAGPAIEDPRGFFGRGEDIKRLFDLWKNVPFQNAAIIGPVRSGKTSLLLHLRALATSPREALRVEQREQCPVGVRGHRWAFVDFQDPRMGDPERLLRHLLGELGLVAPEPCTFDRFLDVAEKKLQTPAIVLLDEIGVALTRYHALDRAFWEGLRALVLALRGRLGFVLASHGSPPMLAEGAGISSSFFNTFGYASRLGPLGEKDVRQLAGSSPTLFAEADVDWIVTTSGGQPIFAQILCRERLAALEAEKAGDEWREAGVRQMDPFLSLLEGK